MEENKENIEHPEKIYSKIIDREFITYKFNQIVLGTKKLISNNINFKDYSKEYEEITKITTFKNPDEEYFPLLKNEEIVSLSRVKFSYDSRKNKTKKIPKLLSSNKIKIKKFKFNNKSLNQNSNDNDDKNIELDINKNVISLEGNRPYPHNNKKLSIRIKNDNYKKNSNILSEESYSNKNNIKLYSEKNTSISSNKQTNNNFNSFNNNKDILQSPTSMSTTTQNSFFNKNKKKVIVSKSMNYYKNKKIIKRNAFILKNNLTLLFTQKKNLFNNRILLRDILLQEKDYNNLKYEANKIFLTQDYYYKYILKQMEMIKKNKIKLEHPEKFEKIYENSKFGKPQLALSPIIIEFKQKYSFDDKTFNINDKQIFNIPFEYIPIFYFNFEKLKEILISIFYLDNSFTTFFSKYENFAYILKNSHEFKEKNDDYKDAKKAIFKKEFTYKLQLSHSQTLNRSTNFSFRNSKTPAIKKRESLKLIDIYKTEYNFNNLPNYINKTNNNKNEGKEYFSNKNIFEFIWITPSFQYLVTLKTPEISFKINGIEIKKNIDIELLFFLSENNFKNWDFYLIEYLFSYNDFINIIKSFFSIYKSKLIKSLKYNYDFRNNVIHLTKEKKVKYSKKNTKIEFIFTNDDLNNHIKVLHNYKLFVFNKNINPYYQFCFHLNFIQMKSLYLASKKQGIKYLLEKIIITDKDNMKIKLNYEYLDNFCKKDLNILEPLLPSGITLKSHKYNFLINDTKFCLFYPILETIKFNNKKIDEIKHNCFESNLEEELKNTINLNILESIFKTNDVYVWPNIIQFIDKQEKLKKQKRKSLLNFPLLYIHNNINKKNPINTISSKNIEIMDINV